MPSESAPSDPLYALARRVLLDALEALGGQADAIVLVSAQAIYLHTGAAELAVAEFTTDSDLSIDPGALKSRPSSKKRWGMLASLARTNRAPGSPSAVWEAASSP